MYWLLVLWANATYLVSTGGIVFFRAEGCRSRESGPRAAVCREAIAPEVGWFPTFFFALAATVWVGGKACGCGFVGGGILLAALRHFVGLSPGPSPSLRLWGGVCS